MSHSTRSLRRKPLSVFVQIALPTMLAMSLGHAATCIVNSNSDDPADASAKVTAVPPGAWSGPNASIVTLRDCIVAANLMTATSTPVGAPSNPGMSIVMDAIAGDTITLADSLPMLFNNTSIGSLGSGAAVTIDGGGAHRIFFVSGLPDSSTTPLPDPDGAQPIAVLLTHLKLQNGKAQGGGGAGGGMGAGGALFVNKNASVQVDQVDFYNNNATGGSGVAAGTARGGGGMGGNATGRGAGGAGGDSSSRGGGGIGSNAAGSSGGGFGGTGIGQISTNQGFTAPAFGGATTFSATNGGIGGGGYQTGSGGFGGGASSSYSNPVATTSGGFGGGGGGFSYEGGGPGVGGGFGGGGGSGGPGNFGSNADGFTGFVGGTGGLGAGGAGGGGGGGCAGSISGHNGGPGGAGGSGGVGAGSGTVGSPGGNCAPYGFSNFGAPGAGGGGAGFGGAVFVRNAGSLTVTSQSAAPGGSSIGSNTATKGAGGDSPNNDGAAAGNGLFLMSGAASTFDIATNETVSDSIQDDSASSLPGGSYTAGSAGGAAITKKGAGTLVFGSSAINTYAGATTIDAGTLQLDGFLTVSPITINSGGTLSGTGGTAAGVTLNNGGVVSPGDSPGTLNAGNLTWNGDGTDQMAWQLGADNTQTNTDLLALNSSLNKGTGTTFKFHFTDGGGGPPVPGTIYTLIRYSSTNFAASDFTFDYSGALSGGLAGTFALTGSAPPSTPMNSSSPTAVLPPNALTFTAVAVQAPTITKAFGAATIPVHGTTTLSFHIVNPNSVGITLNGIAFSDSLPAGLTVGAPANATNTCGGTFTATTGASSVDLSAGTLAGGASCDISVDVLGATAGTKVNTTGVISATGTAPGTTSNTASLTVASVPPTIAKAFNPIMIGPAGTSTLTFTINNPNAAPIAGITFSDNLPAGLEVAAVPNATNTCGGSFSPAAAATSLSLTNAGLGANASCTLSVDVHGTTPGQKDNTTGAISSTESGAGATSNTATLTINLTPVRLQSFEVD